MTEGKGCVRIKRRMKNKRFWLAVPILVLFGGGILLRTVNRILPNVASISFDYSGELKPGEREGVYHGKLVWVPEYVAEMRREQLVLGLADPTERWIEVDLSEQRLKAWDGSSLFLESLVSTGLPWWPTPTGEFRIWVKLRATRMEGGSGRYYYNLPNVPYVMYFANNEIPNWRGFGLHGTYWHNDFGRVHSHGCVNLPTEAAEKLYYWTTPVLAEGKTTVFASPGDPGTRIVIHD